MVILSPVWMQHTKPYDMGFPAFFVVVKTSLGIGRVVGTIIPQYETEDLIREGLMKLAEWNPSWCPQFFMTDKSTQELGIPPVNRIVLTFYFRSC